MLGPTLLQANYWEIATFKTLFLWISTAVLYHENNGGELLGRYDIFLQARSL